MSEDFMVLLSHSWQGLGQQPLPLLLITNLTHFFQCNYLFPFSTRLDQPSAHHQENRIVSIHHLVYTRIELYQYIIWSIPESNCINTSSGIYQMMY